MLMRRLSLMLGLVLALGLRIAAAANNAGGSWSISSQASLAIRSPDNGYHANWSFAISRQHDFLITLDEHYGDQHRNGKLLIVDNKMLLTQGLNLQPSAVTEALNVPILTYKLALHLLGDAVPLGPGSVDKKQRFDITERHKTIRLATASANAHYDPPWSVAGSVEPVAHEDNTIRYHLAFTFKAGARGHHSTRHLQLKGIWQQQPPSLDLPDSTSLADWRIYRLGPDVGQAGGINFGVTPLSKHFATLGALRSALTKSGN